MGELSAAGLKMRNLPLKVLCMSLLVHVAASIAPVAAEPPRAVAPFSADEAAAHQSAWAGHLGRPIQTTNSLGMRLCLIPPGEFTMGSPDQEEWHRPDEILHRVTITTAFYMAATEVTQGQFTTVMGKNPSFGEGDALPVDTVTWEDAAEFCRKLGEKEGARYRLPTEAEWEYACRAGTTTAFYTGRTISTDKANYDGNYAYAGGKKGEFREGSTAAGTFSPNPWGLHDMHGNVWEYCRDWYGPYRTTETRDPAGLPKGDKRVIRGGCWINFPAVCRSANRGQTIPVSWNFNFGFRIVRDLD